ncbi:peptidase S1 and S6, chymotrypsin/Hap [Intrasporangium chromatireducens Q5-1]|uniref:Peptidase S1 and S6, chymotrypsin/Hap n=1 Tax=Intrasporangium chromatireducens Q5-1 TaxID=584657 RepID=W9GMY8_9MICO|nr:trypsin-like peptidase domain-containing protein [Intrasporangium chromatireducens]EWT06188.1 peptidase S1 and S6, chymotrypsin/Hap [Intrasporangium chromatireducens Q5-1]
MTMAPGTHNPMSAVPPPPEQRPTPPERNDREPKPRRRIGEMVGVAVLAAVLASGGTYAAIQAGGEGSASTTSQSPSAQTLQQGSTSPTVIQGNASAPDWTSVAKAVSPSVVSINVVLQNGEAAGSGVIIDQQGHILTNNHVVSGAGNGSISVALNDGRTYAASIVGTDPSTDLAVIKLQGAPSDIVPMTLGDSDKVAVGDPVMAVGNPLGLSGTVTTGIVSALNRPVTTQASDQNQSPFGGGQTNADTVVTNAIQTSAAINPGNSGGALVNAKGELIGINSSIAQLGGGGLGSSGQSGNIGIGFAIPVNEAKSIASQLIQKGHADHAFLGVSARDSVVTDGAAKRAGAQVVQVVSGTPADKAGVKQGDVIIMVNGERIESSTALVAQIREMKAGEQAKLTVVRGGQRVQLDVTLAVKPASSSS